jgi:pyridoxal phosphate enzyme (YggS family)
VLLVGASKTVPASRLVDALEAGLRVLGENRAQELLAKAPELAPRADAPEWHFIGALQRNKVAACAPYVSLWQSVDRPGLGEAIAKRAPGARVLVEVNLGEEPQRAGCPPGEVGALVDRLRALGLDVAGLMTIAPQFGDRRGWFATLRALRDTLGLAELSMGMTEDFELAIEEGATIVRVGRAIFGARPV